MDSRDLGRADLWEESLARSRERRERARTRSKRKPVELGRLGPGKLGGISAVALLGATLPSLLGGRGASHHAEKVAFTIPGDGQSVGVLSSRPAARLRAQPASRTLPTISTGPDRVVPSEHFVSTTSRSTATHRRSSHVSTTTTAPPTATSPTYMAATRSTPKSKPASHTVIESTLAASHHAGHSKGSGGGGLGQASSHKRTTTHRSGSSPNKSKTSTSSDKSSDSTHTSTKSGGAVIHHQSGGKSGSGPGGYVNPLAKANVTSERIDQGVDYSGSGPLEAIGDGKVTYVGTTNTGWPGAYIEYRLSDGPDSGRYVYYAEDVTPAQGLHVGQKVNAGQVIATIYNGSSGIEIGWGAGVGTESYAMQHGQWGGSDDANSVATPAGKNFSALIASLGGPPGKVEG